MSSILPMRTQDTLPSRLRTTPPLQPVRDLRVHPLFPHNVGEPDTAPAPQAMTANSDVIAINLLGEFELRTRGEAILLPPSRKTRALLAYLALADKPIRREQLCELLWDVPDDPRGALRWSLSKLRNAIQCGSDELLVADRQTVALNRTRVTVDLRQARELAAAGLGAASTTELETIAAMFGGPMLTDLDMPNCPTFQGWLVAEREAARRLHSEVLNAILDRLVNDPHAALPHVRALVRQDPYEESSWARFVTLLIASGRRREAEDQAATGRATLESIGPLSGELQRALAYAAPLKAASPEQNNVAAAPAPCPDPAPGVDPARCEAPLRQEIRFCRAADGTRVAYATVGDRAPLVKTANWMNHLEYDWESPIWGHLLRGIGRRHTFLRYDARGNGLSDTDVGELNVEAWVSDLEAVVDAAGLERFPLFGVSQGCSISIAYAAKHPERVSHLILYAGFAAGAYARGNDPVEQEQRRAMTVLMRHGWGQENPAFRQMFTSRFIPGATHEQADAFNELQRKTASAECAARYYEATAWIDVRDKLHKVQAPTLVLHPTDDANVPVELGRQMAAGIPGAQFVALEGKNHLFLEQEPAAARFFEEFDRFLGHTT